MLIMRRLRGRPRAGARAAAGLAGVAVMVAVAAAGIPAATAATSSTAATAKPDAGKIVVGTYLGRTSQGQKIRFKLVATRCSADRAPFTLHRAICFVGVLTNPRLGSFSPTVLEPCADGTSLTAPLYAASYDIALSPAGRFSFTQHGLGLGDNSETNVSTLNIHVVGARVTGLLRQTESTDHGGNSYPCDTGKVTFSATRTH